MNFFKSVFSDDPDPQSQSGSTSSDPINPNPPAPEASPTAASSSGGGVWNFGGLIKTLTSKSESIIETYRRDLQEFGTGLKKEIEVAQGSLDEFGNTVAKGTAQIISKGKDAILAVDLDSDSDRNQNSIESGSKNNSSGGYYSRFDAAVRAVQGDASTYCDEPEDLEEYEKWKRGFSIDGKSEEMERLLKENEAMESVYKSVVPNSVDHEGFWFRYYYKVYRIKKAEDLRARLVKGMEKEDDEDLSWDVEDDDDGDDGNGVVSGGDKNVGKRVDTELRVGGSGTGNEERTKKLNVEEGLNVERRDSLLGKSKELGDKIDKSVNGSQVEELEGVGGSKEIEGASVDEMLKLEVDNAPRKNADSVMVSGEKGMTETEVDNAVSKNGSAVETDEKVIKERKGAGVKSSDRKNESSVVNADKDEVEDLEWDEIEDLSSIDEKKATESGSTSTSKAELRKRLSVAEEDEDLTWDIEEDDDDDKPAKA